MIAASHINLIGLIVIAAIWILSALFKRKEDAPTELPPELKPRRGQPPPPPAAPSNWEEELRRVLGQPAAEPPPIIHASRPPPRRAPPPPPVPAYEPHIHVSLPDPQPHIEPHFQPLPGLTESDARYAEAMTLEQRVTRHMSDITRSPVGTTAAVRREIAPEVYEAVSAIRTQRGARAAVLASIILGPPRALEQ